MSTSPFRLPRRQANVACAFCFQWIVRGAERIVTPALRTYHTPCYRRLLADKPTAPPRQRRARGTS